MPGADDMVLQIEAWRRGDDRVNPTDTLHPILLKFTAKWCGPCRSIPLSKVVKDLAGVTVGIVEIDIDVHEDAATFCNISSIPSFMMMVPANQGSSKFARRFVGPYGTTNTSELKTWVVTNIGASV